MKMEIEDWKGIAWFRRTEFLCHHCQRDGMELDFMQKLDRLRHVFGRPLIVSSGYRCPDYNTAVSETGKTGPHTTGRAVDFAIVGEQAYKLVQLATMPELLFTGIGVSQKNGARFIHLDDLIEGRPRIWSY